MQKDSTPKKPAKRGPKPKQYTAKDYCRFCNCQLVLKYGNVKGATYLSTENLFKVPKSKDNDSVCPGQTLANLCSELGFNIENSVKVSSRVCKPCGRNLRSTHKFYTWLVARTNIGMYFMMYIFTFFLTKSQQCETRPQPQHTI